jgi:hypothetical protein
MRKPVVASPISLTFLGAMLALGAGSVTAQTAALRALPNAGADPTSITSPVPEPEFQELPNTAPLAITVTPAPVPKGQMPEFVTMTLTNTSDHAVRLPQPGIGCTDVSNGTIELVVSPAKPEAEVCMQEVEHPAAVEKWLTLEPGDTANFGQRVTLLLPKGAGNFEVRASYTPPLLSPAQKEELYRDSVTYPLEPLTSAPVTLTRE